MAAAGQTVEGVPAARLARELAAQLAPELPLLAAVNRVLDGDPDPAALLVGAVLPR
jgi:glycerol-3-phosphate dehydrogenase